MPRTRIAPQPKPTASVLPPLAIRNATVIESTTGRPVVWRGINWFGANVGQQTVDGLWVGGNSTATDFSTQLYTLRLLGFNALRLSFVFDELWAPLRESRKTTCRVATDREILERAVDPEVLRRNNGIISVPPNLTPPFQPRAAAGVCNAYMPNDVGRMRGLDRFLYTAEFAARNGFYVVLTFHPKGGTTPFANPAKDMADQWTRLWREVMKRPAYASVLKGRVVLDVMNEPDAWKWRWNVSGPMYLAAMNALAALDPTVLFMVEGAGQWHSGAYNWGLGFVTDEKELVWRGDPASDTARPFFEALLRSPLATRVIVSPHIYGPSISKTPRDFSGPALVRRMDACFGYLQVRGYCSASDPKRCQRFPIIVGEYGSRLTQAESSDRVKFEELAVYLRRNGMFNWMHWSFNANDGDTGGLLFEGWERLRWEKLRWLRRHYDLRPLI